jgi:hypothetical protein
VPSGSTAVVNIDNGATGTNSVATLDQNANIGTLTIDPGDTLNINSADVMVVNTAANVNGTVTSSGIFNLAGGTLNNKGTFTSLGTFLASGTISGTNSGLYVFGGNYNQTGNVTMTGNANIGFYPSNTATLAGYQLQISSATTLNAEGTLNLSGGSITGGTSGGQVNNYGTINGPGSICVSLSNVGGTVNSGAGLSLGQVVNDTGTITLGGSYNVSGTIYNYATIVIGGTPNWTAATPLFVNDGGKASFNTDSGSITPLNVTLNAGTVVFSATQHLASLIIASGSTAQVTGGGNMNRSMLFTPTLSDSGTLDVTANDVDLQNGGPNALATITALVKQGFNNGTWTGTGITSSTAAADTSHLTAIGVILNNQSGMALYTSGHQLDGFTPTAANDVLVKYTYYGDANLDGKVDGSDYSLIDNGYQMDKTNPNALTGWYNGDFNYDGIVNGSDYTLIDNAFNSQGTSLTSVIADPEAIVTAEFGGSGAASQVPEPTGAVVLGSLSVAMLGRRRRITFSAVNRA